MSASDLIHVPNSGYWGQNVDAFKVQLAPGYWEVTRSDEAGSDFMVIMVRRVSEEEWRAAKD